MPLKQPELEKNYPNVKSPTHKEKWYNHKPTSEINKIKFIIITTVKTNQPRKKFQES